MSVTIGFYGAAGEVTGSNFLFDTGQDQYIVDCGLFQGGDLITEHNDQPFQYDPAQVKAVIVTHAHLDHVGRLPKLVKDGFRGPIYATEATIELATLTLKDALGIMSGHHHHTQYPLLYEQADLQRTLDLFQIVKYHQPISLQGSDRFTLFDAGHILGSATVYLEVGGKKIVVSGDIGHAPGTLLPHPETPTEADAVIMEATYGAKDRHDTDKLAILKTALAWMMEHHGVLLIPAFAVERTQELLYLLHELYLKHELPNVPFYLDSPLAIEALEVFDRHRELYTKAVQQEAGPDHQLFSFKKLVLTPTVEDSKDINDQPAPKVIIAGSGMMEGGRIHHHLAHYLDQPSTYLLVIGYQAHNTLGSRLIGGAKEVQIHGTTVNVRAHIEAVNVFSSHADNQELLNWAKGITVTKPNGKIFLVHSDADAAQPFGRELADLLPGTEIHLAELNKTVEI